VNAPRSQVERRREHYRAEVRRVLTDHPDGLRVAMVAHYAKPFSHLAQYANVEHVREARVELRAAGILTEWRNQDERDHPLMTRLTRVESREVRRVTLIVDTVGHRDLHPFITELSVDATHIGLLDALVSSVLDKFVQQHAVDLWSREQ
jgi:hypothetical protein